MAFGAELTAYGSGVEFPGNFFAKNAPEISRVQRWN